MSLTGGILQGASANVNNYRQAFNSYESAAQHAATLANSVNWNNPLKLTYLSWQVVARMQQSLLLNGKTGMNIIRGGELINVRGLDTIVSSGRMDSPGYNFLRSLQNYDEVENIYREMGNRRMKFLSPSIGLGLRETGIIAEPSTVRQRIYTAIEGAVVAGIPDEHEKPLLKRWADTIKVSETIGEPYDLKRLAPRTFDKLQPYLEINSIASK